MINTMSEPENKHAHYTGAGTPNDKQVYEITAAELPLHCPMPEMSLWNSHPRVYLPVEATGKAKCPYCGAEFILK
jgi:uncharacterized Zn-finger protein